MKKTMLKQCLLVSALSLLCSSVLQIPASAQVPCPITFPASPGNDLTSDITVYPYNTEGPAEQLTSWFLVDVTNSVGGATVSGNNPPIPFGLYPTWCVDEWDEINPIYFTVPGSLFSGALYSTCDPDLNSELPPGHTGTLVSTTNWQMVNYILNHQTDDGTNVFYWDVQAAINTLVGSGVGSHNVYTGTILTTPLPDGSYPGVTYPTYNPATVQDLLNAASNAVVYTTTPWVPECGNVIGVIYVTQPLANQFLLLEVPVPCTPCISVTKEIACLEPTNDCGIFGSTASGFVGTNNPGFCYQITVTNCGFITLTNLEVLDDLLGNLTAQFVTSPETPLPPGGSITALYKQAFSANATNTVTVTAYTSLAGPVTNVTVSGGHDVDTIYTNDYPVSATDHAVALVDSASLVCSVLVYSAEDLDRPPIADTVLLPSSTSPPPSVTFSVTIYNTGAANLTNVTITSAALTGVGCAMPPPFTLASGQNTTIQICTESASLCPGLTFSVNVTGQVEADGGHCGIYDLTSTNLITVTSGCAGSVSYDASLSGNVYLHCNGSTSVSSTDSPLSGLAVTLLTNSSPTPTAVATTTTDASGYYTFADVAPGSYIVEVTPPADYSETFPNGSSTSEVQFTLGPCENLVQNFGYADQTTVTVSVPPGGYLGCNATPPTDANVQATVVASDDRGPASVSVSHTTTTGGCFETNIYTVTATGTCGSTTTVYVTNTWTVSTVAPTIAGGPAAGALGCNPTSVPAASDVALLVSATGGCGPDAISVSSADSNVGCNWMRVYTITASNECGNVATAYLTNTWTQNNAPLVLGNVPGNQNLGCN
ncbi:MAG: SdrD B-like domain-containing protein, partial [Verrucomicrobiota bacterium]